MSGTVSDRPRIVLLRRATEPDPYLVAFAEAGFDAACVPVLDFEFVGRKALAAHLANPDSFGGLVLTSPRAADALAEHDLTGWREKPTFVVGPRTAERAQALGLRTEGEEAGSAAALAETVIANKILFLCGDRRRDELPERLRSAGKACEEVVVYRTIGDAAELGNALEKCPDGVVFFSPSGVEVALEEGGIDWNSVLLGAIGPTTAEALREAGLVPAAIAEAPTPEALAAAILNAYRSADV